MSNSELHNRIHLPSFWLNSMMPTFFILVVGGPLFFAYIDFMQGKSIPVLFYVTLSAVLAVLWIIVYFVLRRFGYSVIIKDDSIRLHTRNKTNEYSLNTIKEFNLKTTYYLLAGAQLTKIEFVYIDGEDKIHRIYSSNWGKFLKKSWVKFADNLTEMTKKKFTLSYFIEDIDGKVYPADQFEKEYWKRKHKILP